MSKSSELIKSSLRLLHKEVHMTTVHKPMFEALLEHYAAFIETQTGTPAAETINLIKSKAEIKSVDLKAAITQALLDAVDSIDYSK